MHWLAAARRFASPHMSNRSAKRPRQFTAVIVREGGGAFRCGVVLIALGGLPGLKVDLGGASSFCGFFRAGVALAFSMAGWVLGGDSPAEISGGVRRSFPTVTDAMGSGERQEGR